MIYLKKGYIMGIDVNMYVEVRSFLNKGKINEKKKWISADKWYHNKYFSLHKEEDMAMFEVKDNDRIYNERNYILFSILGNTKDQSYLNKYLCDDKIHPISLAKGMPFDISEPVKNVYSQESDISCDITWLTLKELLDFDWTRHTVKVKGLVDIKEYIKFKLQGYPDAYYNDIKGCKIENIDNKTMESVISGSIENARNGYKYVTEVEWYFTYAQICDDFIKKVLENLKTLVNKKTSAEDIRIVYWFTN